jgi:hypothetical protein
VRGWTDKIKSVPSRWYVLGAVVAALVAVFLSTGRYGFALTVVAGALLGWLLLRPETATWAVFTIAFFVPVTINFGYPIDPTHWVLVLILVVAAWGRLLRSGLRRLSPAIILAALLPASGLIAALVHWYGYQRILFGVSPLAAAAMLCWYVFEEGRRDPRTVIRVARAFAWSSVPIAILAKIQTMTGTWPGFDQLAYDPRYTSKFDPTRAAGISGHPLIFGAFAMGTALVALTVRGRYWYVPFTASLVGLVLSGTRSAWIGMLLGTLVWLVYQRRRLSWAGLGTAVAVLAVAGAVVLGSPDMFHAKASPPASSSQRQPAAGPSAAAPAPTSPGPAGAPTSAGSATVNRISGSAAGISGTARIARMKAGWHGITESPITIVFGHGPEADFRYFGQHPMADGLAQVFDNTYVSVWYNFGLLGLLSLLAAIVGLYWRLRSVPARAIILGTAAQIFFFDVWTWPTAVAVFAMGIALGATGAPELAARPLRELVGGHRALAAARTDPGTAGTATPSALAPVSGARSGG